jgi:hypothetical protein
MLQDFFKGIAWQLEGLEFRGLPTQGGSCIFHALAAYQAIRANGVNAAIGIGSLLARVGPHPGRDVVCFSNGRHMGEILPDGSAVFHCWVRHHDWIFDSSLRDWQRIVREGDEVMLPGMTPLPPVQWAVELPRYWFKHSRELEMQWRPTGTPELGQAWYGPWFGDPEEIMRRIRMAHEDAGPQIANGLALIFNDYCARKGIPRQHDDRIFPLKFEALAVRQPEATE